MNGNVIVDSRRPIGSHYPSIRFYLALKFLKNNGRLSSFDLKIGGAISSYLWIMSHADDFTSWRWYHDTYHIYTLVFALLRLGSNLYIGLKHSRLICSFKRFHFRTNLKTGYIIFVIIYLVMYCFKQLQSSINCYLSFWPICWL